MKQHRLIIATLAYAIVVGGILTLAQVDKNYAADIRENPENAWVIDSWGQDDLAISYYAPVDHSLFTTFIHFENGELERSGGGSIAYPSAGIVEFNFGYETTTDERVLMMRHERDATSTTFTHYPFIQLTETSRFQAFRKELLTDEVLMIAAVTDDADPNAPPIERGMAPADLVATYDSVWMLCAYYSQGFHSINFENMPRLIGGSDCVDAPTLADLR